MQEAGEAPAGSSSGSMPGQPRSHPCPCCGYLVFAEAPGSYEICPICCWEDDLLQLRFPGRAGGANKVSLIDAQRNYLTFGAVERRLLEHTRLPGEAEERAADWVPFDPQKHDLEACQRDGDSGSYPADLASLHYWRRKTS